MEDSEFAENDTHRIKWNNVETVRLDTQRLHKELPNIYDQFLKKTVSRRFQIKAV